MPTITYKYLDFMSPSMLDTGADKLKYVLGSSYVLQTESSEFSLDGLDYSWTTPHMSLIVPEPPVTDSIRDLSVYRTETIATWEPFGEERIIHCWEYNPYNVRMIDANAYLPNFQIPIRFYSNTATTKGDLYWNIYWTGGMWGEKEFNPIIDSARSFYTINGKLSLPYYDAPIRLHSFTASETEERMFKTYSVKSHYPWYDEDIQNRLEYEKEISERLLPNYNFIRDVLEWDGGESSDTSGTWTPHTEYESSGDTYTIGDEEAILQRPLREWYFQDHLTSALAYSVPNKNSWFGTNWPKLWNSPRPLRSRQIAEKRQENIMFDAYYFMHSHGEYLMDEFEWGAYTTERSNFLASSRMYSIDLEFTTARADTAEGTDDFPGTKFGFTGDETGADESTGNNTIRDIIENNHFSSRFLEILKDIDEGAFPDFKTNTMALEGIVHTGMSSKVIGATDALSEEESDELPYSITQKKDGNYKYFDWGDLLVYLYNNPTLGINHNFYFMGLSDLKRNTLLTDSTTSTYIENKATLSVLDDTVDFLQDMYTGMFEAMKQNEFYDHDGLMGTFTTPLDFTEDVNKAFLQAQAKTSAQILAYKVEKFAATPTGAATGEPIQKFWFFNARNIADSIKLRDSQVKFEKHYVYKCTAYAAIITNQYKYNNLRLTKQIGKYDRSEDGSIDSYCVLFYDPSTNNASDQTFTSKLASPEVDGDVTYQTTGLSNYNISATLAQDFIEYPQAADILLNIQPCIKILEVPLFEKSCGVYDNPCESLSVEPFHFIDDSQRVGFVLKGQPFKPYFYPALLKPNEEQQKRNYLDSNELYVSDYIDTASHSPARYLEMYRISKKPTSFYDFGQHLVSRIDLKIPDETEYIRNYTAVDKIKTNKTYYYLFRFISENGMPSWPSSIIEATLVNDGGYTYSLFDHFDTSEFIVDPFSNPSTDFKKMFQLEPNVQQIQFDTTGADFSQPASTQLMNVTLGTLDDKLWDKKFKIRLTSKKTGKKIDLNVEYSTRELDRTPYADAHLAVTAAGDPVWEIEDEVRGLDATYHDE